MSSSTSAMAMAINMSNQLKASAEELYKGLESSFRNKSDFYQQQDGDQGAAATMSAAYFESAIHKMFGACTAGTDQIKCRGEGEGAKPLYQYPIEMPMPQRQPQYQEHLRNMQTWQEQPLLATTAEEAAATSRRHYQQLQQQYSQGTMPRAVSPDFHKNHFQGGSGVSKPADYGEHIYEQLFMDDAGLAASAIKSNSNTRRATDSSRDTTDPLASNAPRFSIATGPVQQQVKILPDALQQKQHPSAATTPRQQAPPQHMATWPIVVTPLGSNHVLVPNTNDFDDTISAVSAYTLEAMALAEKIKHSPSTDSSLFPSSTSRDTPVQQPSSPNLPPSPDSWGFGGGAGAVAAGGSSPGDFFRKRSQHTHESSMESAESHNEWVNHEQGFWEQEAAYVPRPGGVRPSGRSKSLTSRKTNDHTVSTTSCSQTSSYHHHHHSQQHRHQQYTDYNGFPVFIENNDNDDALPSTAFARDPDRINQVLALPVDAELAEI